jgi:hypothetical protein
MAPVNGGGFGASRPRFGPSIALALSLVLHLILIVVSSRLPRAEAQEPEPPPEQAMLHFDLAPPELEMPRIEPSGPPPAPPAPRPQPASDPIEAPTSAVPETPGTSAPPAAGPERPAPAGDTEETGSPTGAAEGEPLTGGGTANDGGPRSSLDLGRALRQFGESLDRGSSPPRQGSARAGTFVPDAGQFPTTGYGMGNLTFETRDFDWSDYARQIYNAIWRAWHNRLYATVDDFEKWAYANGWFLNHESGIRFVIERSGQVSGIVVEGRSGCDPLDVSATQALSEVVLPPLPDDFPKDREVVHAKFIAEGRVHDMRTVLSSLKRYGLF